MREVGCVRRFPPLREVSVAQRSQRQKLERDRKLFGVTINPVLSQFIVSFCIAQYRSGLVGN